MCADTAIIYATGNSGQLFVTQYDHHVATTINLVYPDNFPF